jgi:hypothetical protein
VGHDNGTKPGESSNPVVVSHEINWDSLEITPLAEDQIGTALPVMDEETMYEFVGLRAEDERAKQARVTAEKENEANLDDVDLQDAELLVDDHVPGEDSVLYNTENPPIKVGTIYASMNEFSAAVQHHAIKEQFQLATEKSCKDLFRGHCKAESCPWSIVAMLNMYSYQIGLREHVLLSNLLDDRIVRVHAIFTKLYGCFYCLC